MLTIETERLVLRDFVEADWDAINAMLSEGEITQYMHFSSLSEEERREWFSWCIHNSQSPTNDDYNCAIVHKSTAQTIGWFGIGGSIEEERIFGYLLARPFWGYGYMTEALRAILSYEFETLNTTYIRATCATANIASAKVMERVGMQLIKTVIDEDFMGNVGERHHYAIYNPNRIDR